MNEYNDMWLSYSTLTAAPSRLSVYDRRVVNELSYIGFLLLFMFTLLIISSTVKRRNYMAIVCFGIGVALAWLVFRGAWK